MSSTKSEYTGIASIQNIAASHYKGSYFTLSFIYISSANMAAILTQSYFCLPPSIFFMSKSVLGETEKPPV